MMLKFLVTFLCVLVFSRAAEKSAQEETKTRKPYQSQLPLESPTSYGFVPLKTPDQYVRQEPTGPYINPQYIYSNYITKATPAVKYQPQQIQYHQVQETRPVLQHKQQQQQQYIYQNSPRHHLNYDQSQTAPSNQLGIIYVPEEPKQQYQQQFRYVYVQPIPEPTNTVENVVNPKEAVQYVMFVPTYVPAQENSYTNQEIQDQSVPQYQIVPEYVTPTQKVPSVDYHARKQVTQYQIEPEVQYLTQKVPSLESHSRKQVTQHQIVPEVQYVTRSQKEPSSESYSKKHGLLDSYIPSILQYEYYLKQLKTTQLNQITDAAKNIQQGKINEKRNVLRF